MRSSARWEAILRPAASSWAIPRAWALALTLIGAGMVVAGLAFLYLWLGSTVTMLEAERARLVLSLEELSRDLTLLSVQVTQAYSPQAIAERAKALGMEPFTEDRTGYLIMEDDEGSGG
ncbi:MAG: hypothetical protein XD60_0749 [Acetothermia bacterium 64_32]|nr:MAG: hypothetical protein XD60_0749 [Acetothermia bacterium 64_32]HAF70611.1 hypothetical protein [Candidatus Acetothermia bacterium]